MSWRLIAPARVSLIWLALVLTAVAQAQAPKEKEKEKEQESLPPVESAQPSPDQLPPEEDKPKNQQEYSFNPLRSKKEVTVGEFYLKKNDFRAAAGRFREATRWNDGNAEAWLRLGDAEEKMKDPKAAQEAWAKYLQLAPESKNAGEVRKKLEKLKS
jgi:tetratricopeptide (TPR) repeat protein